MQDKNLQMAYNTEIEYSLFSVVPRPSVNRLGYPCPICPRDSRRILCPDRPAAEKRHNGSTLGPYPAIGGFSPSLTLSLARRETKVKLTDIQLSSIHYRPTPYFMCFLILSYS
jgi:hypothetical protein